MSSLGMKFECLAQTENHFSVIRVLQYTVVTAWTNGPELAYKIFLLMFIKAKGGKCGFIVCNCCKWQIKTRARV